MSLVVDIQCFKIEKNKCIVKELAAFDGKRMYHYVFKKPFSFELLEPELQREAEWVMKNYHSIPWDSGFTPLHNFVSIMKDLSSKADRFYLKGREKAEYIGRYTSKPVVELEEQPRLQKSSVSCFAHNNNISMCALTNVYFLYQNFIMVE